MFIAFSEIKWSEETCKKYEQNPDERMKIIDISSWQEEAESITTANHSNIQSIFDFDSNINRDQLPYDENRHLSFSKDNENAQAWVIFNEQFSKGREQQYKFDAKMLDKTAPVNLGLILHQTQANT